jgi:hypothetical protein
MMAQQGDMGASSTHLTRALYALSAPLPSTFPSGLFRLPYSQIENRAIYLGIARKVNLLVKRGTWRTAFEWAKIGLGMAGEEDPVGMLCWCVCLPRSFPLFLSLSSRKTKLIVEVGRVHRLDFLAPKANQNEWFYKLISTLDAAYPGMRVNAYPGLWFAKALCVRNEEEEAKEVRFFPLLSSSSLVVPSMERELI